MAKTFVMTPDMDPATIDIPTLSAPAGAKSFHYSETGIADGQSAPIASYNYIDPSFIMTLFGDSNFDALVGTAGNDLVFWDSNTNSASLGGSRYWLPGGGLAAIDEFDLGAGDDVINLTYVFTNSVQDQAYTANAIINGQAGSDIIWSGNGNDQLFGGTDSFGDQIYGGGGDDLIVGSSGISGLSGDSGNDTIFGGVNADGVFGGFGNDTLFGGGGADNMTGDDGNDTIYGGNESDGILGGGDGIGGGAGDDTVYGGSGQDDIDGGAGDLDRLYGDSGADQIVDGDGAKLAYGGDGDGSIVITYNAFWSGGTATVAGDGGNGTILLHPFNAAMNIAVFGDGSSAAASDGNDTVNITGSYNVTTALLSNGNDSYLWTAAAGASGNQIDTVFGGAGNDTISTGSGTDFLQGDAGDDTLIGGAGADSFVGGSGTDLISYSTSSVGVMMALNGITGSGGDATGDTAANDVENLTGSNFTDSLIGNAGINVIMGLDGNDTIEGLGNADSLYGGNGIDMVTYANSPGAVTVTLGGSTGVGGDAAGGFISADFENLTGSAFNDTLSDSAGDNLILGLAGNDTILAGTGTDTVYGGDGNDTLHGDKVYGDNGNDLIFGDQNQVFGVGLGLQTQAWDGVAGSAFIPVAVGGYGHSIITVDGGSGTDTYDFSANAFGGGAIGGTAFAFAATTQRLFGIEVVIGSTLSDIVNLTWNDGVNRLAYSGDVSIFVGNGADQVYSGAGNDLIVGDSTAGGVGADVLYGGSGNDLIWGDLQNDITGTTGLGDILYGGLGSDSIFGAGGTDTLYGGDGNDTVFGGTGNDRIADSDSTAHVVDTSIDGGDGADFITADFTNATAVGVIDGGANSGGDLADKILVTGSYSHIDSSLGLGNDTYIGGGFEASPGSGGVDVVSGGLGSDAIAGWSGNDILYGDNAGNSDGSGDGGDALWGGAGSDTVYGGAGSDYLYPGAGGGDIMYGGAGVDYYYVTRTDGLGNQVWDEARVANSGTAENYLVVLPEADPTEGGANPDYLLNGSGVFETDHNITNATGMVQIVNSSGDLWTLNMIGGDGAGTTSVVFDDRDINQIVLWNNDATGGTPVLQIYQWDSVNHTYSFLS